MAQTSIHFQPVKPGSEEHNKREKELDYVRKERSSMNEYWQKDSQAAQLTDIAETVKKKTGRKMKTYGIDYTKISEAESSLYSATRLMVNDCHDAALERIEEARKFLQEFLNQDNLVKDDDLADGLIKQSETFDDDQLDFIRDIFGNLITDSKNGYLKDKAKGVVHPLQEEELAIINVCQKQLGADEFESVEQFYRNKSNTWNEIIEEEDDNQD